MKKTAGKRILMLLENHPYPQDNRVRQEALALTEAGYQVSVICPSGKNQRRTETLNGVHVYRFPAPRPGDALLGYLWEYGYSLVAMFILSLVVLMQRGFSVIHAHNPPDILVLIALFYKPFGKRFVYDLHDLSPEMYYARFSGEGSTRVHRALILFEKLSCRVANHVIATNESYRAMIKERSGIPEERITIVRNGPDLDRLQITAPDPELRQKGSTIIGYVGVMGYQDGVDYLLRALCHLVYDLKRTDIFCVIIGKGDAWEDLKSLAGELDLNAYVWFTGRISDEELCRYLSTADICVDPDPSNPFNDRSTMIKMMEYMALGKPIVAFDLPEHRFTAQSAAVYVSPNDEMAFAQALAELIDDPQRREEAGRFGRHRVETELAWQYSVDNLLNAYQRLYGSPSD